MITCIRCNATGFNSQPPKPGFTYGENTPCPDCKGSGKIDETLTREEFESVETPEIALEPTLEPVVVQPTD